MADETQAQTFSPSPKGVKPLLIVVIVLGIFVAGSAAYLWFTGGFGSLVGSTRPKATSKTAQSTQVSSPETEVAAFRLARQMVGEYSDSKLLVDTAIKKDHIELLFRGKLVEFKDNKSWTLERNGKRIILTVDPSIQVVFSRKIRGSDNTELINSNDLKTGDEDVDIRTAINFNKGLLHVIRILTRTQPSS